MTIVLEAGYGVWDKAHLLVDQEPTSEYSKQKKRKLLSFCCKDT